MYDARAVSNFFYDRAQRCGLPLTIMTLLKVLYFAHGWYLAKYGKPLIAQPFEAWKYGPVNRVVYDQYRKYGNKPLDKRAVSLDPRKAMFVETSYLFDHETEKLLDAVFEYYTRFHAFTLSDLTHEKGSPWDKIWSEAQSRAVPGMVIPNNLILDWFREGNSAYSTQRERGTDDGRVSSSYPTPS